MRLLPRPPADATPREHRRLDVAACALVVGGTGALTCGLLDSTPGALAGLTVAAAGWALLGITLIRVATRRHRRVLAELELRRRTLETRYAARRDELRELRRSLGLPPREEDES